MFYQLCPEYFQSIKSKMENFNQNTKYNIFNPTIGATFDATIIIATVIKHEVIHPFNPTNTNINPILYQPQNYKYKCFKYGCI